MGANIKPILAPYFVKEIVDLNQPAEEKVMYTMQ